MKVLVDIVVTAEVVCDTLDDLDATVTDFVNASFPDEIPDGIQSWHLEDSFTVVEP